MKKVFTLNFQTTKKMSKIKLYKADLTAEQKGEIRKAMEFLKIPKSEIEKTCEYYDNEIFQYILEELKFFIKLRKDILIDKIKKYADEISINGKIDEEKAKKFFETNFGKRLNDMNLAELKKI